MVSGPSITLKTIRELRLMRLLKGSKNVVELLEVLCPGARKPPQSLLNFTSVYSVMPHYKGGNLASFLSGRPIDKVGLDLTEANRLYGHIRTGLTAMHRRGVMHRDLKPAQIFLDVRLNASGQEEYVPVVGDLGSARIISEPEPPNEGFMGDGGGGGGGGGAGAQAVQRKPMTKVCEVLSPDFIAPEHLVGHPHRYDFSVDVWSLGVIYGNLLAAVKGNEESGGRMFEDVWKPAFSRECNEDNLLEAILDVLGPACVKPSGSSLVDTRLRGIIQKVEKKPEMRKRVQEIECARKEARAKDPTLPAPPSPAPTTLELLKIKFPALKDSAEGIASLEQLEALLRFDPLERRQLWDPADSTYFIQDPVIKEAEVRRHDSDFLRNCMVSEIRAW